MEYSDLVSRDRCGVAPGLKTVASGLTAEQLDTRIVDEGRERTDRVRASAHAGDNDIGQTPLSCKQLGACFVTDDTLQVTHEFGEGMRPGSRPKDVVRRLHVGHPITEGLIDGVLKRR